MARAIVTLAVGDRCLRPWQRHLLPGWRQWVDRHGYALVVFDQPLDTGPRSQARSPAWQKLLAMAAPELQDYDQALWLDADVLLRPGAPDPLLQHNPQLVAMARDGGSPLAHEPDWFRSAWSQVLTHSLGDAVPPVPAPFSYLDLWGFDARRRPLFNSGVVAFSPARHGPLFRELYHRWSDGGSGALHEMVPLNLELQQRRLLQELDGRFNTLFGVHHAVWRLNPQAVQQWQGLGAGAIDLRAFATHLARSSYFLHFAGAHGLMQQLLEAGPLP
jgi:hypothetical protein